ncbi:MAG TPA: reverse transcriptase family protein [Candidatus Anaerotruncus excrementipullorum]|uniref:RNA-directed DNA polymerase n=1 Tax=Candidatus Anaerotruncus excrementipullorum TaxID=2838465 RepID=A0A9D1WRE9_9FIRM|nr:reverse transcriptase family protein [Candidatus Anaerotruncus excrementipullorum]
MLHTLEAFCAWHYGGGDPLRLARRTRWLMRLARGRRLEGEYRPQEIPKRKGGTRKLLVPSHRLAHLQRGILRLLEAGEVSAAATAYEPGCSLRQNALPHRGARLLVRLDLADFFGSISFQQVFQAVDRALRRSPLVGRHLLDGYDRLQREERVYNQVLSFYFARFCTYRGHLPQGAPTSPHLSNLVFFPLDEALLRYCTRRGITYTRYSDDLAFSGETFSVGELLRFVQRLLAAHGFRLNEGKTVVAGPGQRKRLPGVVVSHKLQADVGLRRQLRQEFYYIGRFGLASHLERTGEQRPPSAYLRRLLGRTGFVLQVNPEDREFQEYLERGKRWLKEQEERAAEG